MPVLGFRDHWAMSCSLNLASCRLRAEALARQLHTNLWSPRSTHGSPGDSGCVSPCFGLPSALAVVDRPPVKLDPHWRMSSLDDEEEQEQLVTAAGMKGCRGDGNGDAEACSSPRQISPPYSPMERIGLLSKDPPDIYGECKDENHVWRPDSPPESFGSESEVQSDSPALTIETEDPGSTQSNSTETVSELASPTYDYKDEGSPLADELRSRLKLIQSCQTNGVCMTSPIDKSKEESSVSSSLSSETTTSGRDTLLSPPDCPRLVRSTSLKTGKTPPGTPSRKKIVRFADVLGLDLEAIRHFVKDDDAPIVPLSAFADLKLRPSSNIPHLLPWSASSPGLTQTGCQFVAQFEQPGSDPHFLDKVRQQKVCLENAVINDLRVTGVVRVLNLGFEKLVQVRYTTTEWAAHTDLTGDYVPNSCDGFSDKFSFSLHLPHLSPGQRLLFALRYVANGQEFWDNNSGENYVLKCQAKTTEQETTAGVNGPRWLHHFM